MARIVNVRPDATGKMQLDMRSISGIVRDADKLHKRGGHSSYSEYRDMKARLIEARERTKRALKEAKRTNANVDRLTDLLKDVKRQHKQLKRDRLAYTFRNEHDHASATSLNGRKGATAGHIIFTIASEAVGILETNFPNFKEKVASGSSSVLGLLQTGMANGHSITAFSPTGEMVVRGLTLVGSGGAVTIINKIRYTFRDIAAEPLGA